MSKAVKKFNGLSGTITEAELKQIAKTAKAEGQTVLYNRCMNAIKAAKKNKLEVFEKEANTFEQLPSDCLCGLDATPNYIDPEDNTGLNKAVSPDQIYQMITDKFIKLIEKSTGKGGMPEMIFPDKGYSIPFNFDSKKAYRGINAMMLTDFGFTTFENPFFLTFKQIQKHKGKLIKGSKGHQVVYFTQLFSYENDKLKLKFSTYNKKKFISWIYSNLQKLGISKNEVFDFVDRFAIPILKYYNVFNGQDVEGVNFDLDNFKEGYLDNSTTTDKTDPRIKTAELILENYPNPKPKYRTKPGKKAFYQGAHLDQVTMPKYESYLNGVDFYRVNFHEHIHSTGHPTRINRPLGNKFGSPAYAKEELIAEFGAVFLSAQAGFLWRTEKNSADYLKNWQNALKHLKKDNRLLMRAASAAQKAADFVLNLDADGVPAFEKQLSKATFKKETPTKKETPVKKTASVKKNTRPTTEDLKQKVSEKEIEILTRTDFEKALKGLGLTIFSKKTDTKNATNFKVDYQLNFKDVAGATLELKAEKLSNSILYTNKLHVFNLTIEDSYDFDSVSDFYDETFIELKKIFTTISLTELSELKKEYKNTLFSKTPKNQLALLGPAIKKKPTPKKRTQKKRGLNSPEIQTEPTQEGKRVTGVNSLPSASVSKKVTSIKAVAQKAPLFNFPGETGKFFQAIERKPVESVVIGIDTAQGTGKTTSLYKCMNDFANGGNKCLFASLEEHPTSNLATSKRDKFLDPQAQNNIDTVAEFDNYEDFCNIVAGYDGIFIDSWQKLIKMMRAIHLDEDIRKAFNGKVFFIIFQQTTTGRAKGGAEIVFDCDIVTKGYKGASFSENYLFFDKNRYTEIPLENLKYMIEDGKTIIENEAENTFTTPEQKAAQKIKDLAFSFKEV